MSDRKAAVLSGILRSIMELCAAGIAVLEPEPTPEEEAEHPLKKRLAYLGADEEPEPKRA